MPKIVTTIPYSQMLEELLETRRQVRKTAQLAKEMADEGCEHSQNVLVYYDELLLMMDEGIGNIHAAIENLYVRAVPRPQNIYKYWAKKMSACEDCEYGVAAQDYLTRKSEEE